MGPPAFRIALHSKPPFSGEHVDAGRDHGAFSADDEGIVGAGQGFQRPLVDQAEVGHVQRLGAVVDQPGRRSLHGVGQRQVQSGKQGERGKDVFEVALVFAKIDRCGEPVGLQLVAALRNRGQQQLPAFRMVFGAGLKLQGVEEPVFDVREMAADDAGGLVVVESGAKSKQTQPREQQIPDGDPGDAGHEQVKQRGSGAHSESAHSLQRQDGQPRDRK